MNIWQGDPPHKCDLCQTEIDAFVDGRTQKGFWAIMCVFCALEYGVGLGEGKGQLYTNNMVERLE